MTIRVDLIKRLSIQEILDVFAEGNIWVLVKRNENEAFVETSSKKNINKMIGTNLRFRILGFECVTAYLDDDLYRFTSQI